MYKKILTAVDFSDMTNEVITNATQLATLCDAKLRLLHVEPNPELLSLGASSEKEKERLANLPGGEEYCLKKMEASLSEKNIDVDHMTLSGKPSEVIIKAAEEFEADLIILGSHGHGKLYHFLGGGGTRVAVTSNSKVPVLIVKNCSYCEK